MNFTNSNNTTASTCKRALALLLGTCLLLTSVPVQAGKITRYVHTDHLGSPSAKTDSTGIEIWRQSHSPYGESEQTSPSDGPGYTGHRNDAGTGLVYMQARYYDPVVGRFLSIDPDPFINIRPSAFNRYWYVSAQVFNYIDPTGMTEEPANLPTYTVRPRVLPTDLMRFFWFIIYYAEGSAGDGTYDRKVRVFSANGTDQYYRGSTKFTSNYCEGDGGSESCPDRPDGTYALVVKLGFNRTPQSKKRLMLEIGEMSAVAPNSANGGRNAYSGIWIHSGVNDANTGAKGCLTIDPNQWQDFISNFSVGGTGSIFIDF